nr:hypothetical protein [Sphingomonas sp. Y57]
MAVFPRPSKPSAVWADFKALLRQQERHKLLIALVSILMPGIIVTGFYVDSKMDPPKAQVIYVQSWPASRTDAEIIKQNLADQKIRDAQLAEKQRSYRKLADQLGIDYEQPKR